MTSKVGGGPLEAFMLSAVELGQEAEYEHLRKNERIYLWQTAAMLTLCGTVTCFAHKHMVCFHQEIFYLARHWEIIVEFYQIQF